MLSVKRSGARRALLGAVLASAGAASLLAAAAGAQGVKPVAPNPKEPGARGVVAGQVPAQHKQALEAPVSTAKTAGVFRAVDDWWDAGSGRQLPAEAAYQDPTGKIAVLNTAGAVDTKGHPFFEPLGTNGRACVTCHQPADAMSVSVDTLRSRWAKTLGKDPVFAAVDGSNCPGAPQDQRASHSLLLERGLFRIFLPWPPKAADGTSIKPEFTIEVVRDPTGCNTDPVYGLKSANPMVSVYRRPRLPANLKYVVNGGGLFNIKTGMPTAVDPDTGKRVSMNIMADARQPTLKTQAVDAVFNHEQGKAQPTSEQLQKIVEFESQVFVAQGSDKRAGSLTEPGGPAALGPHNLATTAPGLGDNFYTPVFPYFEQWKPGKGKAAATTQAAFRASVARGRDIYMERPFWIRDATHLTSIGLGNPIKRTCATCHNAVMTGMDVAPGWMDIGVANLPTADPRPDLPLFKITCSKESPPHPYLGRVIYTHDPGRALISGQCIDVGSITMQQFRGLAARAPYFSNGSAKTLRELVDYYDRRFAIKYSEQEKRDLTNFLSVL